MSRAVWCAPAAHRQSAQDVVEYGLLIALIVVVVLLAVNNFGQYIFVWFEGLASHITTTGT
jgi:Flp pilus assembly pilin Flp